MKKLLLILSISLAVCANVSWASWKGCDKAAAEAADIRWGEAVDSEDPEAVTALYANDAVLLPTFSDKILTDNKERLEYFEKLHKEVKNLRVHFFPEKHIQVTDDGAVSSGFYIFTGKRDDGEPVFTVARYTFAYKDSFQPYCGGCQLITHHSSVLPTTPDNSLALLISE